MAMKYALLLALLLLSFACAKRESVEAPPATTETTAPAPSTQPAPPNTAPAQATVTLPADAPIPKSGVLLWLAADDALASATEGKVRSWQNARVPNVTATAHQADHPPAVVANALHGHAVVRFDGTDQMLMTTIDIGPARMPEGTIITVFSSTTADASPLRKVYGNDNGGYDRSIGLDDRAPGINFTLFNGTYVIGYFPLAANTPYLAVDEYSRNEFSGWVNGTAALTKSAAEWQDDALPNLFIGGSGTVFNEYWSGDVAEMIVYARKLSDEERKQVEDYLGQKYGVTIGR